MPETPDFLPTPDDDPVRAPVVPDTPRPTEPKPAPDPPEGYPATDPKEDADDMDRPADSDGSIKEHPPNVII